MVFIVLLNDASQILFLDVPTLFGSNFFKPFGWLTDNQMSVHGWSTMQNLTRDDSNIQPIDLESTTLTIRATKPVHLQIVDDVFSKPKQLLTWAQQ